MISILLAVSLALATPFTLDSDIQRLEAPRPAAASGFGFGCTIQGEWMAVYSDREPHPRDPNSFYDGAVHLYRLTGGEWTHFQSVWPSGPPQGMGFTSSIVFGADDEFFIGSAGDSLGGGLFYGAIYRYEFSGSSWGFAERITMNVPRIANVGGALAFDEGRLYATAPLLMHSGISARGGVVIFEEQGNGWRETGVLDAIQADGAHQLLGIALAVDGSDLVVSTTAIEVVVFSRLSGSWQRTARLLPSYPTGIQSRFGYGLSLDDGRLAVSDSASTSFVLSGRVSMYSRQQMGAWSLESVLTGAFGSPDSFGVSLDLRSDLLIVGADRRPPVAPSTAIGSAFLFSRVPTGGWQLLEELRDFGTASGAAPDRSFGSTVRITPGAVIVTDSAALAASGMQSGAVYSLPLDRGRDACVPSALTLVRPELRVSGAFTSVAGTAQVTIQDLAPLTPYVIALSRGLSRPASTGNWCLGSPLARLAGGVRMSDASGSACLSLDLGHLVDVSGEFRSALAIQARTRFGGVTYASNAVLIEP